MAKGDAMGGAASGAAQMAPKMDQYSVMHKIFDHLGGQSQNRGPMSPMMNQGQSSGMFPGLMAGGAQLGGAMAPNQGMMKPNYGLPNSGRTPGAPMGEPMVGGSIGTQPMARDMGMKDQSNMQNGLAPDIQQIMQLLFGNQEPMRKMM